MVAVAPGAAGRAISLLGGRLSADEWHRAASQALGRSFPPVLAQIPDNPEIGMAHDKRRLPLLQRVTDERRALARVYREGPLFRLLRDSSNLEGKCGACEKVCPGSPTMRERVQ